MTVQRFVHEGRQLFQARNTSPQAQANWEAFIIKNGLEMFRTLESMDAKLTAIIDVAKSRVQLPVAQPITEPSRLLNGPLTVTLQQSEHNSWIVRAGDRYENELGWDEALGCIAAIILRPNNVPYLRDAEQHKAFEDSLKRPIPESELLEIPTEAGGER